MNRPSLLRYGIPVLTVAAVAALRLVLWPVLHGNIPFVFFFAPVVISAWYGGAGPGLLATLLSAASVACFLLEPRGSLRVHNVAEMAAMGAFLATGALVSHLMEVMHRERQRAVAIFDNAGVGLVETAGVDDRFVAVNDRICRILGYRREQLLGMNVHALTYPEDQPGSDELNAQLHEGNCDRIDYEKRYRKQDGSLLWVHVTVSPVRDAGGRWVRSIATVEDIQERKRAEEGLRESETRLRTTIDSLTEGVIVSDLEGNLLHWNPAAVKIHGIASPEEGQRGLRELDTVFQVSAMDGTVWPVDQWPMSRVLHGENLHEFEARLRNTKDNRERIFSYGGTLVRDSGGRPQMAVLTINDVTERKQAEEDLRRSEEQLRLAALAAQIGVWSWTPGTSQVVVSGDWRRLFGIAPDAAVTFETWVGALHPEDRDRAVNELNAASEEHREFNVEYRVVRPDGTSRWVVDRGRAWYDNNGRAVRMAGINVDITERKQAEEALRESENRFRTMANALPLLAWIAEADGYIYWYNDRWYEYTGTTPEQMEGWGWQRVHDPDTLPKVLAQWKGSIATGQPFDMVFPLRGADGVFRPFLTRIVPLKDAEGHVVQWVGSNVDITERKQVEDELERRVEERTAQLKRANERLKHRAAELDASNRELEAFSYSVSHDLRTPLRAIDGFSLAAVQEYSDKVLDARGQEYLQRVRGATQRLGHLIDDFQSLTKTIRTEMHRQPVDLSRMAAQVLAALRESEPDRQVEAVIAPEMVAEADPHLLRTALENLLGNAWKFTRRRPAARIEFGQTTRGGERVYSIRDNGAGFDPAYAAKLFIPFQRLHTDEEFPGSGLGLALVQRIIRRHGGRIWAEGAVDQGATFFFTLEGQER